MSSEDIDRPLNRISTLWSVVCQAHDGPPEEVSAAQSELLCRYRLAIHRYLLGALRDPEAADELGQEFALRVIRGDFRTADPQRGRFRDFLKGVLSHLIADHYRRRGRSPAVTPGAPEPVVDGGQADLDRQFLDGWRQEVLARAWEALAQVERHSGQPFHTVLRARADHPELRSDAMAERLSARLGRAVNAGWVRQTLRRAREKFIDQLVEQVVHTLQRPTPDDLEQELGELGLLEYCRSGVERFRAASVSR
jgi:RNA polymerase sigma-70 factor (ECF subfamily)